LGTLLLQLAGVIEASGLVDRIKKGPRLVEAFAQWSFLV
jgi:hypothetical protein